MNVNERIDALSEADAKAALEWLLKDFSKYACFCSPKMIKLLMNLKLDEALMEVRK